VAESEVGVSAPRSGTVASLGERIWALRKIHIELKREQRNYANILLAWKGIVTKYCW